MVEWSIVKSDLKAIDSAVVRLAKEAPSAIARAVYNAADWSGYFGREYEHKHLGEIAPDMPSPVVWPLAAEAIAVGVLSGSPYAALADAGIRLYHMRYEAIKEAKKAKSSSE